jgi:exodeoxyribonuclease V alpha subunit
MNAATPERQPTTEQISGLIERVTFHSDDSGFCVLRVKVKGQRDFGILKWSTSAVCFGPPSA